jgi:Cys-rich repeat protein
MHVALTFRSAVVVTASLWVFSACGSSTSSTTPTNDAATTTTETKANGTFEIHYVSGATSADSYAEIGGFMYDSAAADLVIWDKKTTDGNCSLYQPRTPFCESCASGQVCVDTNVCRTPPSTYDVGDVTMTGLTSPSGANPLRLTTVTSATGTTYLCAEDLPVPPCTIGATVGLSATGKGDYPAFSIQTQCIAPLVVTNSAITLQSGTAFTLTWTPSTVAGVRIDLEFDLSHHGGSKGKVICETSDSGSLQVSSTLVDSLLALGVTGYPKADVTRVITGTTAVGSGQAQLKLYSDQTFVVQIPNLISCQNSTECPSGQTCQVPGQMCGVSCTANSDCPTGQTCSSTKICK